MTETPRDGSDRIDPVGAFVRHSPPPITGRDSGPLSGLTCAAKPFRRKTMALISMAGLAALPQVTIPATRSGGIPVGLSFMGWTGGDQALLDLTTKFGPHCISR